MSHVCSRILICGADQLWRLGERVNIIESPRSCHGLGQTCAWFEKETKTTSSMFFDIRSSCCLQKHHLHSGFHPVCSIQSSCSAEHPSEKNSHQAAHSNCSAYVQCAGLVVSTTHMTFNRTCCGRIVFTTLVTHTRWTHIRHHCKRAHQEQNVTASCGNVFITCLYHGSIWIWSDMFVMQFCTCCISCWHGHSSTLWTWGDNVVQGHYFLLQTNSCNTIDPCCRRHRCLNKYCSVHVHLIRLQVSPIQTDLQNIIDTCNWYSVKYFHESHGITCSKYLFGMIPSPCAIVYIRIQKESHGKTWGVLHRMYFINLFTLLDHAFEKESFVQCLTTCELTLDMKLFQVIFCCQCSAGGRHIQNHFVYSICRGSQCSPETVRKPTFCIVTPPILTWLHAGWQAGLLLS